MEKTHTILLASRYNARLQEIIQANFEEALLRVETLPAEEAVVSRLAKEPSYPLIILDLAQTEQPEPGVSQLAAIAPDTLVLLLVSVEERGRAIAELERGAFDYLLLPISAADLSSKINRALEIYCLRHPSPVLDASGFDGLKLLNETVQQIVQTLKLEDAIEVVLTSARQVAGAELAKVYLADQNGKLHQHRYSKKNSPLTGKPAEDYQLFTLAQQAAETKKFIYQRQPGTQQWQNRSIVAALVVPMISREKLVGVLALGKQQSATFLDSHIEWLSVFCDQAAIAIENARLFQALSSTYIDMAQSHERVLNSHNTLQAVFDGIPDGLYVLDQNLVIKAINQVEAERQDYEAEQLIGQSIRSLAWTKAASELLRQIKAALTTGRETSWSSAENEHEPHLKDREFRIYPIRNRQMLIEQVVVFAQDVSERRRWQASLFRSANLAAVGQLAGSVAHQINNPLTVTMANSQLLLQDTAPHSELHELAHGIFKASERIQNTITNLLEFSNQEQYFFVRTDLIGTIEGALELVTRSLKKAHILLEKDYQFQPMITASVSHLKLVWVNLLLNARDAVASFATKPKITIATRQVSNQAVKVTIADNGIGLSKAELDQLFRPFFSTKPAGKALGLGLYSAYTIIEQHRGQISAVSQPGVATTFEVILPLDNLPRP